MDIKNKIKELQLIADQIDYCHYLLELKDPFKTTKAVDDEVKDAIVDKIKQFLKHHVENIQAGIDDIDILRFSSEELSILKSVASRFSAKNLDLSKDEEDVDEFDENKTFTVPSLKNVIETKAEKATKNEPKTTKVGYKMAIILDGTAIQGGDLKEVPPDTKVRVLSNESGNLCVSPIDKPGYRFIIHEDFVEYI